MAEPTKATAAKTTRARPARRTPAKTTRTKPSQTTDHADGQAQDGRPHDGQDQPHQDHHHDQHQDHHGQDQQHQGHQNGQDHGDHGDHGDHRNGGQPARGGWDVALDAARQLQQLTGNEVEAITGLRRTGDGWCVQVDVLELRRVPSTTDVIATYEVDVDRSGDLMGYHRQHRFVRGEVGEDR